MAGAAQPPRRRRVATPTNSKGTTLLANDALLVVLAGLFLTLLLAAWAARYWRKTGRRQGKFKGLEQLGVPGAGAPAGARAVSSGPGALLKPVTAPPPPVPVPVPAPARHPSSATRASRRRVRAHRPRNPTLAEIGGLPPLRPDPDAPPATP